MPQPPSIAVMAHVLITGSADGLGLMAARLLLDEGHDVTLHARSPARADDIRRAEPRATSLVIGDLASIAGMRSVAGQANDLGGYDAVIHNAGVGYRQPRRIGTADGLANAGAPDDLSLAPVTQAWLAVSDDPEATVTGGYFYHQKPREPNPAARDTAAQDALLAYCAGLTCTPLPARV